MATDGRLDDVTYTHSYTNTHRLVSRSGLKAAGVCFWVCVRREVSQSGIGGKRLRIRKRREVKENQWDSVRSKSTLLPIQTIKHQEKTATFTKKNNSTSAADWTTSEGWRLRGRQTQHLPHKPTNSFMVYSHKGYSVIYWQLVRSLCACYLISVRHIW